MPAQGTFYALVKHSGRLPSSISWTPQHSGKLLPFRPGCPGSGRRQRPGLSSCLSLDLPWICLFLLVSSSISASSRSPPHLPTLASSTPSPQGLQGSVSTGAEVNRSWSCHGLPSSLTCPAYAALNAIHLLVVSFSLTCLLALPSVSLLKAQTQQAIICP